MLEPGVSEKQYAVVGFADDESIEVIPSIWLINGEEAKWPNETSITSIARFIRERKSPSEDWSTVKIKLYAFSNSFLNAKKKARTAQDTSQLDSDSSDYGPVTQRKRKVPIRFQEYVSLSDQDDLQEIPSIKTFQRPTIPAIGVSGKMYAVVGFVEDGSIEVIPSAWLINEEEAKWPSETSITSISRFIRERKSPSEDWSTVKIKLYAFSNSFSKAKKRALFLQDTSYLDSYSSDYVPVTHKKRKIPIRFRESLSTSDEDDLQKIPRAAKKYCLPTISSIDSFPKISEICSTASQKAPNVSRISSSLQSNALTGTPQQNIMHRMFAYIELVHEDIKQLKKEFQELKRQIIQLNMRCNMTQTVEEHFVEFPSQLPPFPICTDEQLHALNQQLSEDKNLSAALVRFLYNAASGKTPKAFIRNVTKKLLTKEVAVLYSRLGRKGKQDFSAHTETLNVIIAATSMAFNDVRREDLLEMFGRSLALASEWEGRTIKHEMPVIEIS